MTVPKILQSAIIFTLLFILSPVSILACYCWDLGASDCTSSFYMACSNAPKCCETTAECDPNPPCPTVYYGLSTNVSSCSPHNNGNNSGVSTAIGCLDIFSSPTAPIQTLLSYSVRLASGTALLLFAYAGFQLIISGGDPKKFQLSKEIVSAVIGGLVLISLSLVLLNFIGTTVLQLGPLGFQINPF